MTSLQLDNNFDQRKSRTLAGLQFDASTTNPDKSPKGYIDEPIIPLIACINQTNAYYTTSSCSGRISLFLQHRIMRNDDSSNNPAMYAKSEKGGKWLLISHDAIANDEIGAVLMAHVQECKDRSDEHEHEKHTEIALKFEPFILHIECRDLCAAMAMLSLCRQCGLRESGINAISNRIMLRITFNIKLDVPLYYGSQTELIRFTLHSKHDQCILPNVNANYLHLLSQIANAKMNENLRKIESFYAAFKAKFMPSFKWYCAYEQQPQLLSKRIEQKMDSVFARIEKLKQTLLTLAQIDKAHISCLVVTNKQECTSNAQWCLLVHRVYHNTVCEQLQNFKLTDKNHQNNIQHHSVRYKADWRYIPIPYDFACTMMSMFPHIDGNKLKHWYNLYENVLSTHRNLYSFDMDLLLECINVIPYYSQWTNVLNAHKDKCRAQLQQHTNDENTDEEKTNLQGQTNECVLIGLCFRRLPKPSMTNLRSTLQSAIFARSNNKQWRDALLSILDLLCNETESIGEQNDDESVHSTLTSIVNDFPTKYEKYGDCMLFPSSFSQCTLKSLKSVLSPTKLPRCYQLICQHFKCDQVGLQQAIRVWSISIIHLH